MVFSSIEFLLFFLPIFFILYGLTPNRCKNVTLLAGSLVFYTLGERRYLPLLVVSVAVNYFVGRFLGAGVKDKRVNDKNKNYSKVKYKNQNGRGYELRYRERNRREWRKAVLFFALMGNLGTLLIFKSHAAEEALPLGLSFYTFQIASYLIDVCRGDVPAERSFFKFAVYITMFPKLVSGPLVSYGEVSEALDNRRMSWRNVQHGLKLFTLGLAAKVLLADRIGLLWNDVQVRGFESISTPLAWMGALAFSLKIYFDFGGYSLMAMGLGGMMGFSLPDNFKTPYMARSVRDFYRRWHITLGRWFCDYVYIPLGGNRRGELCTVRNLLIVWALTGLWHGGRGNFLLWGILLWMLIVVERQMQAFLERHPVGGESIWKQLSIFPHLYLWAVIPVTWMCFAITDVRELAVYLGRMFGAVPQQIVLRNDWSRALQTYGELFGLCFLACTPMVRRIYRRCRDSIVMDVALAVLFWICVWRIMAEGNNPFMYTNF